MKNYIPIALLTGTLLLFLQSCHVGTSGSWKNDNINPNVKAQINQLNKKLFKSIMTKDVSGVKQLMSPVLLEVSGKKVDTIINNTGDTFNATDYKLLDEYYTKNSTTNVTNNLFSGRGDNNDYQVNYLALNEEMYASLLVSKKDSLNCLVLAIYGKYGDKWKLNILQIGQYNMLDKTAPDYYKAAQEQYKKGNIVDASDLIIVASQMANPGGKFFKYKLDDEMKNFYSKVLKEANSQYNFPITAKQVKTNPIIFAISPQFVGEEKNKGIYPIIKYKSTINLNDTVALKAENNAIQKNIGQIFKGVDQNKHYILYAVFNQIPDGKAPIDYFKFLQTIK